MPDTPVVQEEEFAATVIDVPIREGEQRFQKALNLEDVRRRESVIQQLTEELRKMRDTAQGEVAGRFSRSRAARKRQKAVIRKVNELQKLTRQYDDGSWEGPCAPATIINLNPVPLKLDGQLQRYTLAAAGKGSKILLAFRGRKFTGSYMTITTPEVWLTHTGIELDPIGDTPQMEANYIPPVGLAWQFGAHYCGGGPSVSDAQNMGGVLIFEGDIHVLDRQKLAKRKDMVRVPVAEWSTDVPGELVYESADRSLEDYLATELSRQRTYAEAMIAQGHSFAISQSDIQRNQLSNGHITWHNYALEMGYIQQSYPWASEKLQDSPLHKAVFCPDCRTRQEDPEQYFCRNCNAPFDAYKAFMAGKDVPPSRLAVYDEKSKEFQDILAELDIRRKRLALLGLGEEPAKKKAKKDTE